MGKIEAVLKGEILRLSRREARSLMAKHVADVRRLRQRVVLLERELRALKAVRAREQAARKIKAATGREAVEQASAARLSPNLIRSLRSRLGISQADLAKLVGVSSVAVGAWESARSRPRANSKARIVALRSLGRREVRRLLAERTGRRGRAG